MPWLSTAIHASRRISTSSLLLGEGPADSNAQSLTDGILAFTEAQYNHSRARNRRALLHRYRPWLTPWLENPADPIFVQEAHRKSQLQRLPTFSIRAVPLPARSKKANDSREKRTWGKGDLPCWKDALASDFMEFLAYRSRGNVKRLKATLERFIEPSLKVLGDDLPVDCQHVLVFRDTDRFRIQLISEIYRRILSAFDPRIRFYDDKLVVGLLYIADFLLKFHRRAFAWSSLQKVDELVHIHRAPELPTAIADLLHAWQQKYLHRILNGMYDYRFNSDFSMELQYLSKRSDEELAALNFTLDESQALKSIYRNRFAELDDPASYEFVAGLGELHELDGEHDVARYYYNRALNYLDEHFHAQVARKKDPPAFYAVLSQTDEGLDAAKRRIAWGMARLRLKMQVGMSYELSNDLEQAQAHYRNARTYATALLRALLNAKNKDGALEIPKAPDYGEPDYVSTLKHLNLIFQPAFAEAWVSEKHLGGVDTSSRLIERSVWELRWKLPLVREEFDPNNLLRLCHGWAPGHDVLHFNFALIMAEQHNKIGDLMFFKGGVSLDSPEKGDQPPQAICRRSGYLVRSRYHYTMSLHELRFFNRVRRLRWVENHGGLVDRNWVPVAKDEWGDFAFRAISGSLADFGETFLAETSTLDMLFTNRIRKPSGKTDNGQDYDAGPKKKARLDAIARTIRNWLASDSNVPRELGTSIEQERKGSPTKSDRVTAWNLTAPEWQRYVQETVFGQLSFAESPSPGAKLAPTLEIPESWLPPFEKALAPWFGTATRIRDLFEQLPDLGPGHFSRYQQTAEADIRKYLEESCTDLDDPSHGQASAWGMSSQEDLKDLSDGPLRDLIHFEASTDPLDSFATYVSVNWTAGRTLEAGGLYEDAGRKYLQLLETVVDTLTTIGAARFLQPVANNHENGNRITALPAMFRSKARVEPQLIEELLNLGMLALGEANRMYGRARVEWDTPDGCDVGTRLPTQALILTCALGLAALGLRGSDPPAPEKPPEKRSLLNKLEERIIKWLRPTKDESGKPTDFEALKPGDQASRSEHRQWLRSCLIEILERNAYPLMGRLTGLKVLIDDSLLTPWPAKAVGIGEATKESQKAIETLEEATGTATSIAAVKTAAGEALEAVNGIIAEAKNAVEKARKESTSRVVIELIEAARTAVRAARKTAGEATKIIQEAKGKTAEGAINRAIGTTREAAETAGKLASKAVREVRRQAMAEACQHLSELTQLEDLYDGRWHFTPFQLGSTLALWTLQRPEDLDEIEKIVRSVKKDRLGGRSDDRLLDSTPLLREEARRRLVEGQEMYTMRRSYYRAINRLFYLHDDFNDRRIHYNHAVQMTMAEVSKVLLELLDQVIDEESAAC